MYVLFKEEHSYTRLISKAWNGLVRVIWSEADFTMFQGNLLHCFTLCTLLKIFLKYNLNLSFMQCKTIISYLIHYWHRKETFKKSFSASFETIIMPLLPSMVLLDRVAPNVSVFCYRTYILHLKLFLLSLSRLAPADSPFCWSAVLAEYPSRAITLCGFKLY